MKTFETTCIGCGKPITFEYYEMGDTIKEWDYEITHKDEVGWWDHECPHCGFYTPHNAIEFRVEGSLEGFVGVICESVDELKNFLKILQNEHSELF